MSAFDNSVEKKRFAKRNSLVAAIGYFNKSVELMNSTVLVPTRLKNIKIELNGYGNEYDLNNNGFHDDLSGILNGNDHEEEEAEFPNTLLDTYLELNAIKKDLNNDKEVENAKGCPEELETREPVNLESLKLAFTYHVYQLNSILHELARQADSVTTRYCNEVNKKVISNQNNQKKRQYYICASSSQNGV